MNSKDRICRLCCHICKEQMTQPLNGHVEEMLDTLLIKLNLKITENPVICTKCKDKLEEHFRFQMNCIYNEKNISPFITENVKINLNEIRNNIIKPEEEQIDKNVCRLCLEFSTNDMILSESEKQQLQSFFPEVNLKITNFVIICPQCYNTFQNHLYFVSSCLELEEQLNNYYLDQSESEENKPIKLETFYELFIIDKDHEQNALILKEEVIVKNESDPESETCAVWIKNTDKTNLCRIHPEHLYSNYKICSENFDSEMFTDYTSETNLKNHVSLEIKSDSPAPQSEGILETKTTDQTKSQVLENEDVIIKSVEEEIIESSKSSNMELSRKDVFFMVKDNLKNEQKFVIDVLKDAIFQKTEHVIQVDEDEKSLGLLFANFRSRWKAANRGQEKFLKNNEEWLKGTVRFSTLSNTECTTSTSEKIVKNDEKGTRGRPWQSFASSSDRAKRRKTQEVRSTLSTEELTYAAQMSLRSSGQVYAAQVLQDVTLTSPTRASKYIAAVRSQNEAPLTPDEALSLMIEKGESKRSYQLSRNAARAHKCKLYPSYHEVEKAKNRCYPSVVYMNVSESCAQIKLQALLDHTTYRIIQLQAHVIDTLNSETLQKLVLHCKWGCDGSSSQSVYKQKFAEDGKSDESIFYTSLVPLQLIHNNHEMDEATIVWKNPRPSSPRFCRPIRLQFVHDDVQSTPKEVTDIEQQIEGLIPYTTEQNEKSISVTYCMSFTMIDGKVCNAVTSTTSAQRCFLCKATSKDFNNIDKIIKMDITTDNLRFGISTLHAWIRFFECCLHLSYKLTTQKWQAREEEVKKIVKIRKEDIQTQFKIKLGLIVDRPKPGYGSSNDGNTTRRFFENATISAEITGVDENVIHRFHVILQVISSGYDIDEGKFKDYCVNTARLFAALYPWYYMPTSVHKVLMHGAEIVKYALLPIGQLSEEAQESRNKDIKNYRLHHSRKCSRVSRESNMRDIFNRLLVTSDPFLSSIRKLPQRPAKSLHKEAIQLLKQPEVTRQETRNDSDLDTSGSTSESESNDSNIEDDIQDFCY